MIRTATDCDACSEKDIGPVISVYMRSDEATADGYKWDRVDLCPFCAYCCLERFEQALSEEQLAAVYQTQLADQMEGWSRERVIAWAREASDSGPEVPAYVG